MRKKRREILHNPSTIDVLYSLSHGSLWSELLLGKGKEYEMFLKKLIENQFYRNENHRRTIKSISMETGFPTIKVTKWINEIYNDLFELNMDNPELFKNNDGIQHTLYFKWLYDNGSASWDMWLKQTPRLFENFTFYFVNAKFGTPSFWVKSINHEIIEGQQKITVFLEGGNLNRCREWLLERAEFEGEIGFMDRYVMNSFELDKILHDRYRS